MIGFHRVLYRMALRENIRSLKMLWVVLISLVPLLAGFLMMIDDADDADRRGDASWAPQMSEGLAFFILPVTLPLAAVILAGGMLADEIEDRTISYLLTRPVTRGAIFGSRAAAMVTLMLPIGLLQFFGLYVARLIAFAAFGDGASLSFSDSDETITAGRYMLQMLPAWLGTSLLAAVYFPLVFGAVSIMVPRYHFFVNLAVAAFWEGFIGHLPSALQWLTGSYYFISILDQSDPTIVGLTGSGPGLAVFLAVPLMLALLAGWFFLGARVTSRRNIHVTSAAT